MTVFSKLWFLAYQDRLLWLLNAPVIGVWFRWVLRINGKRSDIGGNEAVLLLPNCVHWHHGSEYRAEFRTHAKFSKRLYCAFRPLWWAMHFWDWCVADRWIPELSFGFNSLTFYPNADADVGKTSCDGIVFANHAAGAGVSWATLIAEAGSIANDSGVAQALMQQTSDTGTNLWRICVRSIFLFDTASLTASATISAATQSHYGSAKADALSTTPDTNIYSSLPASNTDLVAGDFDSLGATAFCDTALTYNAASTTAYNDFAYNATGLAAIAKTGITKTGTRNANYDVSGTPPTWSSGAGSYFTCITADTAGTSTDPKLVVTFTLPGNPYYAYAQQ